MYLDTPYRVLVSRPFSVFEKESLERDWPPPWITQPVRSTSKTVRSDVKERVAEERLAWNDNNILAWPKNISVL